MNTNVNNEKPKRPRTRKSAEYFESEEYKQRKEDYKKKWKNMLDNRE